MDALIKDDHGALPLSLKQKTVMLILSLEKCIVNSKILQYSKSLTNLECKKRLSVAKDKKCHQGKIFPLQLHLSLGDHVANFKLKSTKDQ